MYTDFEKSYIGEISEVRTTYNNEVSQVEFNLKRSLKNTESLLAKLKQANGFQIDPFVTQNEINQYRDSKISWLEDSNNEPHIVPVYFQTDRIAAFIEETAREFIALHHCKV